MHYNNGGPVGTKININPVTGGYIFKDLSYIERNLTLQSTQYESFMTTFWIKFDLPGLNNLLVQSLLKIITANSAEFKMNFGDG